MSKHTSGAGNLAFGLSSWFVIVGGFMLPPLWFALPLSAKRAVRILRECAEPRPQTLCQMYDLQSRRHA